jgi:hypothetical protein
VARASYIQTAFNGGELDPKLEGRTDLQRYATSCRSMQNFIPSVEGPAVKRAGTRYVLDAFDHDLASRLIPFEFSRAQAYVLEFSEFRIRFYRNNGVVLETDTANTAVAVGATTTFTTTATNEYSVGDSVFIDSVGGTLGLRVNGRAFKITAKPAGNQYTIAFNSTGLSASGDFGETARIYEVHTPYASDQLDDLAFAQSADVLYLNHPDFYPRKLLRFDDDDWTLSRADGGQFARAITITSITNANPGVFTTATPHELAVDDFVWLTRVQGMQEVNGMLAQIVTVPTELSFTVRDPYAYTTAAINTTGFHFDGAGGAGVANIGFVQRVITHDWKAFAPENLNDQTNLVVVTGSAGQHRRTNALVRVHSSEGIFATLGGGSFLKIREVPEELHTKWESVSNMNNDITGGSAVGMHAHWERRVYELINKNGQANTGTSPPIHEREREQQLDHRWTWEFENYGDGYLLITETISNYQARGIVFKQLPFSCFDSTGLISDGLATSSTADPVRITVASTAALADGERVLLSGFTTATELNGLLVYVDVISGTTFDCYYDAALTRGVDGINAGTTGTVVRFVKGQHRYARGAWDSFNSHPRAIAFYEDRLVHAGTALQPQTQWLSATSQYESHDPHDTIAGGLNFTLNAQEMNAIEWLFARRGLALGTQGGEFVGTGQNPDEAVSGENVFRPFRMTSIGVRPGVRPVQYGNSILYVQRAGREVREFVPDTELVDEHVSNDISVLSSHLFAVDTAVSQLALQREPNPMIWAVLSDGGLVVCVYDRQQNVVAWAPMPIGGPSTFIPAETVVGGGERATVESIAVIPHPDGKRDQLWLVVARRIDGNHVRYIEVMENPFESFVSLDGLDEPPFYVDAGLSSVGIPRTTVTGLDHLEGELVHVYADGVFRTATVTDGAITLPVEATVIAVGLPIPEPTIFTQRLEFGGADGPAQGKFKRLRNLVVRLFDTGPGLYYGTVDDLDELDKLTMRVGNDVGGASLSIFSGDTRELELPGDVDAEGRVCVKHVEPFPCTVTALIVQTQVEDD